MKRLFYVEFVITEIESDPPYAMQSGVFATKQKAKNWFRKHFDYVAPYMSVRLMSMDFNEDETEYEIGFVEDLN